LTISFIILLIVFTCFSLRFSIYLLKLQIYLSLKTSMVLCFRNSGDYQCSNIFMSYYTSLNEFSNLIVTYLNVTFFRNIPQSHFLLYQSHFLLYHSLNGIFRFITKEFFFFLVSYYIIADNCPQLLIVSFCHRPPLHHLFHCLLVFVVKNYIEVKLTKCLPDFL
jgi:hypothetical protein